MHLKTQMQITVFDYGAGNLHSLVKALELSGATVRVDADPAGAVTNSDALVLPGVGAFTPAAERLAPGREIMRDALMNGLPCLGICLGMQLFFDGSDEGVGAGLGIIPGRVTKLRSERIPQIGWNPLEGVSSSLITTSALDIAYYANSYACRPAQGALQCVNAWSEHDGDRFPASVAVMNTVGTQFHPEKSSAPGVAFVAAFIDFAADVKEKRLAAASTLFATQALT